MKSFLWDKSAAKFAQGSAYGKAILIGEHAAVYGYPALSLPLHDVGVTIEINRDAKPLDWNSAWEVWVRGQEIDLPLVARERLSLSLALAVKECWAEDLEVQFVPCGIRIRSEIPLGAGMGGSAAISAALTRLLDNIAGVPRPLSDLARIANLIDGFFHGNASGLDAATVVASNAIEFVRGKGTCALENARPFYVVLIDSQERAHTSDMVSLVAQNREKDPTYVNGLLLQLGVLVEVAKSALRQGDLSALGAAFNEAHATLRNLGVSTPKLNELTQLLRNHGALGAKVTGAGGGGLVLGLFAEIPAGLVSLLSHESGGGDVYTTCVPSNVESLLARK